MAALSPTSPRVRETWSQNGFSMPTFFTGVVLIIVFGVKLQWFPSVYDTTLVVRDWNSFLAQVRQMVMPVTVLALYNAAQISRFMRSSMLDNLTQDYVRTARAKGLGQGNVIGRHALKNAMIPILTVIGISFSLTMAGAIIVESVFSLNGLGRLMLHGIQRRDYPVLQGGMLVIAFSFVIINLLVDILYSWLDPRVRYD